MPRPRTLSPRPLLPQLACRALLPPSCAVVAPLVAVGPPFSTVIPVLPPLPGALPSSCVAVHNGGRDRLLRKLQCIADVVRKLSSFDQQLVKHELYTFIGEMYTIGELSRESHSCECLGF